MNEHPLDIYIRSESPRDVMVIRDVVETAFKDAPHTDHTEQFIVDALRNSGQLTISIVAEYEGRIIGHVAISPVVISDNTAHWYGVGPVSVIPEYQRRGVGTSLMHQALQRLRNDGAAGCVVLGDPYYYSRFGFQNETSMIFSGVPAEYFQTLLFHGELPCGTVTYHESFTV